MTRYFVERSLIWTCLMASHGFWEEHHGDELPFSAHHDPQHQHDLSLLSASIYHLVKGFLRCFFTIKLLFPFLYFWKTESPVHTQGEEHTPLWKQEGPSWHFEFFVRTPQSFLWFSSKIPLTHDRETCQHES